MSCSVKDIKLQEADKTGPIDKRLVKSDLRAKLQAGELKAADLVAAERLARQSSSPDNLTLYSMVKRTLQGCRASTGSRINNYALEPRLKSAVWAL